MTWLAFLNIARKVLFFTIPIPVAVILAAALYVHFYSIPSAIKQYVSGAELQASKTEIVALQKIADEQKRRADNAEAAGLKLAQSMADVRQQKIGLQDEINKLQARPVDPACRVGGLIDELRNN